MTISYQYNVQDCITQMVEVTYDELTSGVAKNLMKLPAGAIILDGTYWVAQAFNSATSDTCTVAFNGFTLLTDATPMALVCTQFTMPTTTNTEAMVATSPTWLTVTWTGAGAAPTTGKIRIAVRYIIRGRAFTTEK